MKLLVVLLLMTAWFCTDFAYGQDTTGNLEGTIVDLNGDPVIGANVHVTGPYVQGFRGGSSGMDGRFRVLALPVGVVEVRITFIGFEDVIIPALRIELGTTASLEAIVMRPSTLEMEAVTVTGERPAIDLTTTTIGSSMTTETFSLLPIDRDITSVVALLPQANTSYLGDQINIGGATGNENAYYVDGVNTTSPFSSTSVAGLPYNFVREIQIKTGGYEAEYGRATGGIVTVLTESGSNTLKVSAFGFLSNNALSSESRKSFSDQISTGEFLRYDAGFGIGGPILKDRLWYYAAYNRKVESRDVLFDAIGVRSEESVSNIYAAKLSWRASEQTHVDVSAFGNPTSADKIGGSQFWTVPSAVDNEETMLGRIKSGTNSVALNATHIVGDDLLLEGTASWFTERFDEDPATELGAAEPFFVVDSTNVWSGGYPGFGRLHERRAALSASGTWFLGRQSVKAGFQYEENLHEGRRIIRSENGPNVAIMTGETEPYPGPPGAGAIEQTGPNSWRVHHQNDGADVYGRNASAFIQTRLRLSDDLSATLGLRWDTQAFRSQDYGYRFTLPREWQPRLGLIYEPGNRGNQKVFVHLGRFYEQVPLASSNTYMVPPLCWWTGFDHDPRVDPTGGSSACLETSPAETLIEDGLSGQYYDAISAGYQRLIDSTYRVGVSGTFRSMGEILNVGFTPGFTNFVMGNPGEGRLDFLPKAVRNYAAFEFTFDRVATSTLRYGVSYVLSRNYGNYAGVYGSDTEQQNPNATVAFSSKEQVESGGKGPLPNDRTHVLKLNGSYKTHFGLTASTFVTWQTGTPLTEFSNNPSLPWDFTIVDGRGGLGRTNAIWDASFRITYDLNQLTKQQFDQRLILDILHAFSPREPVSLQTNNQYPNYLEPTRFQLPMTIRLGVELEF